LDSIRHPSRAPVNEPNVSDMTVRESALSYIR
jgi:hypothetical protein